MPDETPTGAAPESPTGPADVQPDLTGLTPPPEGGEPSGAPVEPPKEPPLENQYAEFKRRIEGLEQTNRDLTTRLDERSHAPTPSEAAPQTTAQKLATWTDERIEEGIENYRDDSEYTQVISDMKQVLRARSEERVYKRLKAEEVQTRAARKVEERGYESDNPITKRAQLIMTNMQNDPEGFINRATEIAYIMAEHELSDGQDGGALSEFQREAAAAASGADVGLPAAPKLDDVELDATERAQAEAHEDPEWANKMLKTKRELVAQRRG